MANTNVQSPNIVCFESQAFYALIEEVVERIKDKIPSQHEKWIGDEEAMKLLRINSKTTLQKYRDEGKIRYSQPSRKVILYDRQSILDFIEQHAKDTF
ncbi:MAG: helix-turn-helix domain-containing protein [Bacteroidota bacterium]